MDGIAREGEHRELGSRGADEKAASGSGSQAGAEEQVSRGNHESKSMLFPSYFAKRAAVSHSRSFG